MLAPSFVAHAALANARCSYKLMGMDYGWEDFEVKKKGKKIESAKAPAEPAADGAKQEEQVKEEGEGKKTQQQAAETASTTASGKDEL